MSDDFFEKLENEWDHFDRIRAANCFKSKWEIHDHGVIDFAAPHPFTDAKFMRYDLYWGQKKLDPVPITGTSWLDLWRTADALIAASGDDHHVFVDEFEVRSDTLILMVGS